jgi:putative RNA 2'-phosphotransferase
MRSRSSERRLLYLLRHSPGFAAGRMNARGVTSVEHLWSVSSASMTRSEFDRALRALVETNRVENIDGRIRALYGHSLPVTHKAMVPPSLLFHGTSLEIGPSVFELGLSPVARRYVHLTTDLLYAQRVSRRRNGAPLILEIDAFTAHNAGVSFYRATATIWLSREIPPAFLKPHADVAPTLGEQQAAIRTLFLECGAPLGHQPIAEDGAAVS